MHIKYLFLYGIIYIVFLNSCSFRVQIKEQYFSDSELIKYVQSKNYPMDIILKFKDQKACQSKYQNNIKTINCLNIYGKDNELIKATDGENCEFKLVSFFRDSVLNKNYTFKKIINGNLSSLINLTKLVHANPENSLQDNTKYKIVIGWSILLNNYKLISNRLDVLNKELLPYKKEIIIVGLNMDPPKEEIKN